MRPATDRMNGVCHYNEKKNHLNFLNLCCINFMFFFMPASQKKLFMFDFSMSIRGLKKLLLSTNAFEHCMMPTLKALSNLGVCNMIWISTYDC